MENLDTKYKKNRLNFNDIYIIPCENIGSNNEKYIKLITLPFTNNILTMFPLFDCYEVSNDDDEIEEYQKIVSKRLFK